MTAQATGSTQLAPSHRVRVFVDFWNYSLFLRDRDPNFRTDWAMLGPVLSEAATRAVDHAARGEYQGMGVYGSFDPDKEKDRRLRDWAMKALSTFPGVSVSMTPRKKKRKPTCPSCYEEVASCPACGGNMRRTEEKGVDVRIATDMISLAWLDNYDIAVLASSDRDFVPVVKFLGRRGIKVVHAVFPPTGAEVTAECWGAVDIMSLREQFRLQDRSA